MPARHYALEYNVNNGPWIVGRADEAPGAGKEFTVPGLPVGTHAVKLRLVPLVGDPTPIVSNEVILQMGNPGIAEPVQTVAQSEVTVADLMIRRDALIAATGVVVSAQDAAVLNEALLTSAGVTVEVVDNVGIRSTDSLEAAATATATIADVQTMLEQVQAVVTAAATQTDGAVRIDAVSAAADVVAGLGSEVYTPGASAPTQPVITATGGDTTVTITKTSGGTGATSYDLKWGTSAGSRTNTISGVTLPYTHTGRTNGTTYYYSLIAVNGSGSTESAEVSAAASVTISDNFNRADGGLGSNWTTVYGMIAPVISSGRVTKTGNTSTHAAYWSTDAFTADQWAISRVYPETLLINGNAAADTLTAGAAVREGSGSLGYHVSAANFNDMYDTELTGFTVTLWKNGAKVSHYISDTTDEYTHLKITAIGNTVTVYGGQSTVGPWTQLTAYTDPSPIATGSAGAVLGGGSYATFDDWSGGNA